MAIEQKGPGGVSSSYGQRKAFNSFDLKSRYDSEVYVKDGNTLVGPDGQPIPLPEIAPWQAKQAISPWAGAILPTGTARMSEWAAGVTSGTVSVDHSVLFGGRPTTKAFVTGAATGTAFEVGFSSALQVVQGVAAEVLDNYVAIAVHSPVPVYTAKIYIGDATFANYYEITASESADLGGGWSLLYADAKGAGVVATVGTPDLVGPKRMKVTCLTSQLVGPGTYRIGYAGVVKRTKATVVLTCDDGYIEWNNYLFPALVERGIPASFSIDAGYVGTAGFMSEAQLREAIDAHGDLIEYVNHGANNTAYTAGTAATYKQTILQCDELLTRVGTPDASRKIHTYVQGSYDQALVDWLVSEGYVAAREVGASNRSQNHLAAHLSVPNTSKQSLYAIPVGCNLDVSQPVSTAIGYIENAKARGEAFFLMGHEFKAAPGTQTYVAGYHETHGMSNLLDYLAAERDAGNIDLIKWSDYVKSFRTGRPVLGVTG